MWAKAIADGFNQLRTSLSLALHALASKIHPRQPRLPDVGGKMLKFEHHGWNLGHPVIHVFSQRGGFTVGTVEWSNQWGRARFKAHPEAIFDRQCIAEIYACMRDLK